MILFARFVRADDPRHDIPPDHVFCKRQHRRIPYLLTDQEVARLQCEAGNLGPIGSLRPHTYRTIFGLLAAPGLRISEVYPDSLRSREKVLIFSAVWIRLEV